MPFFDEFDLSTVDILLLSQYVTSPVRLVLAQSTFIYEELHVVCMRKVAIAFQIHTNGDPACTRILAMCISEMNAKYSLVSPLAHSYFAYSPG